MDRLLELYQIQHVFLRVSGTTHQSMRRIIGRKNSGIMVEGTNDSEVKDDEEQEFIDFYGQLKQIIKLQYNSTLGVNPVLFRCD